MLKVLSFQKLKYFLLAFQILFVLFLLFNSQFSSAHVCLPLEGYLVWPETSGNWEQGRIPMASSSTYVLTSSPFYVFGGKVGLNTTNPVYTLQVNGDISGNRLCIGNDCRSAWPSGGITGSGSQNQVAFWTDTNNLSGSSNLLWDNNNSTLQVNGNVVANNFLGRINASNVSAGTFGANTGGGNYSFLGNVGIGTTAPGYPLHVYKNTTGWLSRFQNTNAGGSSVYLAHGGGYGAYIDAGTDASASTYALNVNKAGTSYLYVRGDGNVGIGTTNPSQKLDVIGYVRGSQGLCIGNDCRTSWPSGGGIGGSGTTNYIAKFTGSTTIGNSQIYDNGTNVGIGTTAPGTKLHVKDGTLLQETGAGTWNWIEVRRNETTLDRLYFGSDSYNRGIWSLGGRDFGIYTEGVNRIMIKAGGNVGIGTTAPGAMLDVAGTARVNYLVVNPVDAINEGGEIRLDGAGTYPEWFIDVHQNRFRLHSGGTEKLTIVQNTGYVGIGTITPAQKLHVVGNAAIDGNVGIGTRAPTQKLDVRGWLTVGGHWFNQGFITFEDHAPDFHRISFHNLHFFEGGYGDTVVFNNGNVGIGTTNPGYKLHVEGYVGAWNYYYLSDIRFKQNILPLNSSGSVLEKLNNLEGVYFKWNDVYKNSKRKDNKRHIGLIAQEVEKEFPELVFRGNDGSDYLSVDYGRFTAVLLEGLKELNQKLEEFKNKIENSILKVKELIADFIQVKKIRVDKIEMVDQKTGEIYCTWLENGELQKSKGECR